MGVLFWLFVAMNHLSVISITKPTYFAVASLFETSSTHVHPQDHYKLALEC
jgi:hypothetical protein